MPQDIADKTAPHKSTGLSEKDLLYASFHLLALLVEQTTGKLAVVNMRCEDGEVRSICGAPVVSLRDITPADCR